MINYIWIAAAGVVAVIVLCILCRLGKIQKNNIIEWLLFAVTEAEKQLGGGTGDLKLRIVYDWFIAKYPVISKFVSFSTFSYWVDIALDKLKEILTNAKIESYVKGGVTACDNS